MIEDSQNKEDAGAALAAPPCSASLRDLAEYWRENGFEEVAQYLMEKPHKNQLIERRSFEASDDWHSVGIVTSVDGNICRYDTGSKTDAFIWKHPEGLNTIHRWKENPPITQ
jgi:hypothetical protein